MAYEQVEDLKNDGVVYFETRFAPVFHTKKGLTHQHIVPAVLKELERGRKDFGVPSGLIICAMRHMNVSLEMAELAVDFRDRGVVGFDLAGEEGGYPPKKHIESDKISILRFTRGRGTAKNQSGRPSNIVALTALDTGRG